MENAHDQVKTLVAEALESIATPAVPLSSVLCRAIRIARLRGDAASLAWIELELRSGEDAGARNAIRREIADMVGAQGASAISKEMLERYIAERELTSRAGREESICGLGVAEMEQRVEYFQQVLEYSRIPAGNWHHQDLYAKWEESQKLVDTLLPGAADLQHILGRIRHRLNEYLSRVEQELLFVDSGRDAFDRVRALVERNMERVAPEALTQFVAAYRRQREGDVEARSHALTSCRRILKTLADALYPATGALVMCADGVSRKMTDDRFVSRILQFVFENSRASSSRSLAVAQLADLGTRLEAINALSSKGVHGEASSAETDQCVLATYLVVADLLIAYPARVQETLDDAARTAVAGS